MLIDKSSPIKTDHVNWDAVLRHYDRHHRTDALRQIQYFRSVPTLDSAVREAALARDHRGKRYRHQTRIRRASLTKGHQRLAERLQAIERVTDFDGLLRLVSEAVDGIGGLGELWRYDTAFRIGANLELFPEKVYLHSGTRVGARRLGLTSTSPALDMATLPKALRGLPPHECEDVLCIYKDWFPRSVRAR